MVASGESADGDDKTVSFVHVLAGSARFKELFAEGMQLVEDAAAYLDGPGRLESKVLPRSLAQAYSAESMRLTTRLMQIASWLLIRRAVSSGEMTVDEADSDRTKVRLSAQSSVAPPADFARLPERLQELTQQSLRLQSRILHLNRMVNVAEQEGDPSLARRGLDQQFDRLRSVFGAQA